MIFRAGQKKWDIAPCRVEIKDWSPDTKKPLASTVYITIGEGRGHNCWGVLYADSLRMAKAEDIPEEPEKVLGTIQSRCQRIDVPDREQRIGSEEERLFFDLFVQLMRLAYGRKIRELRAWSETASRLGREKQCRMLSYFQHLLRDNFIYNLKQPEMISLTEEENQFSGKFARFINENNIIPIAEETDRAQRDITQNVNARMVFFDYALHIIVLLIQ